MSLNTKTGLVKYLILSFFALSVSSCLLDDTTQSLPAPHNYESLNSFFKDSLLQITNRNVSVNEAVNFESDFGTTIGIAEGQLLLPNGDLAEGNVDFELIELINKSDLVMSGLSMLNPDGNILEMVGGFSLTATKGNSALDLNNQLGIEFNEINPLSDPNADISVYYTGTDNNSPLELGNSNQSFVEQSGNNYQLTAENLGWIIATQEHIPSGNTTELTLTAEGSSNAFLEHNAYVVFNDFNGVVRLQKDGNSFSAAGLPVGESATVLMTALDINFYYIVSQDITIAENQTIDLLLREFEAPQFIERLKAID